MTPFVPLGRLGLFCSILYLIYKYNQITAMAGLEQYEAIRRLIKEYLVAYKDAPNKEQYKETARQLLGMERLFRQVEKAQSETPTQVESSEMRETSSTNVVESTTASKTLSGSVGQGGTNKAADVLLIQSLLNQKAGAGLQEDGKIGPNTIGAISRFQQSIFNGWSDGRVDPGGNTFRQLSGGGSSAPSNSEQPTNQSTPTSTPSSSLQGAVGQGGANNAADVLLIQSLLNKAAGAGLQEDGKIGPNTIGAINRFQQSIFSGWSDGLVEPGGKTYQSLQQGGGTVTPTEEPTNNTGNTTTPTTPTETPPERPTTGSGELQGTVGQGGANNAADVRLVQELLNKVGASISVNGQADGPTIAAIHRFQKSVFNWSDGLIEPGQNTWKKLKAGEGSAALVATTTGGHARAGEGYKIYKNGAHWASIPDGASGTLHVVLLFGGALYANADWMMRQVPAAYHKQALIYTVEQRTGFSSAQGAFLSFFGERGLQVGSTSICGFSGGGPDVQFANGSFKARGLIDPYINPGQSYSGNIDGSTIMEYYTLNWGGNLSFVRTLLPQLAEHVRSKGGKASSQTVAHENFPAHFLKKYQSSIL